MKTPTTLIPITITLAVLTPFTYAQYHVHDPQVQAAIIQGNQAQMEKWIDHLKNAQDQLNTLNEQLKQIEELKNIAGNPMQALQALGLGELGQLELGTIGETADALQGTISVAASLADTAQGLYKEIPSFLNGIQIPRNLDDFKKFASVEGNFENYVNVTQESLTRIAKLRKERENTIKKAATTESEQREKAAKIATLNGEIESEQAKIIQAKEQLEAQHILNENNEAKQRHAWMEYLRAQAKQSMPYQTEMKLKTGTFTK